MIYLDVVVSLVLIQLYINGTILKHLLSKNYNCTVNLPERVQGSPKIPPSPVVMDGKVQIFDRESGHLVHVTTSNSQEHKDFLLFPERYNIVPFGRKR